MSAIERLVAADEFSVHVELVEHVERLGDGVGGVLARRRFRRLVGVRPADLARILRELQHLVGGARHQRIERADDVEHGAIDHRALLGIGRVELRQPMLAARYCMMAQLSHRARRGRPSTSSIGVRCAGLRARKSGVRVEP